MAESITERYHVRRREFLNEDPEYPAFVIAVVQDTSGIPDENEDKWKWGTIILDFGDCSRRVSFDFDMSDASERANSLRKITLIADAVTAGSRRHRKGSCLAQRPPTRARIKGSGLVEQASDDRFKLFKATQVSSP